MMVLENAMRWVPMPSRRGTVSMTSVCSALGTALLVATVSVAEASTLEPRGPTEQCHTGITSKRVPNCETVIFYVNPVAGGDDRIARVQCPARRPYFWNWDVRTSPGMHATLLDSIKDKQGRDIGAVVRLDEQTGHRAGESRVLLGCSSIIPKLAGRMTHRGYHPTAGRS